MRKLKEKYEKFIVDVDRLDKPLYFTCNPSKLGNLFGANPEAPNFLTPVFFDRKVLEKYYFSPEEYSVDDGCLSMGIKWGIRIDNNLKENVSVYLGDLGSLPHEEQLHWKIHNIPKGKISQPFFKRNILAEFSSPTSPPEYFKEKMAIFTQKWKNKFGWDLFKPLNKGDEHHWKTLRMPKEKSQKEFDENITSLIKILIDSLNQDKMGEEVGHLKDERSISLLDRYLKEKHGLNLPKMVSFLRDIQDLRSKGSAHRKGEDFSKFYEKYDKGDFSKTFETILINAIKTLNTIENKIVS